MPDRKTEDKILLSLNEMLAANDRLAAALNLTARQWPYVSNCWIDQLSEPTDLLSRHRVEAKCGNGGFGLNSAPFGGEISVRSVSS